MVVLKNGKPELSYILAELLSMSERVLFYRLLEGLTVVPVFKNVGEKSISKNYRPAQLVFFLCLIKSSKNL